MKYTVLWTPPAENELTEIWLEAPDRNAITQSSFEIDERLEDDPDEEGESRFEGRRILLVPPLGVTFRIQEEDRTVLILDVWRFAGHDE